MKEPYFPCWPTTPNIVGCYMLRPFAHTFACCWMLLRVVAQSLKRVKLFSQQLPTFLLLHDRRGVAQQCWIRLHSSSSIVGATHAHYAWLQSLTGYILPTMHCRSQQCWELLRPFARSLTLLIFGHTLLAGSLYKFSAFPPCILRLIMVLLLK